MITLFKALFANNTAKKANPIAASIEFKEAPAKTWWS